MASATVSAQYDPMFTQYMFNELFINPAYAGSHEHVSTTVLVRDQWVGIEGSPKTQTFSIHAPIKSKRIGLGLSMLHESIGVSDRVAAYGNFAFRIPTERGTFALGLQGGVINFTENLRDVKTINNNDQQFAYNTKRLWMPNAGFGMYYNTERFFAGLSIPRLIDNKVSVASAEAVVSNVAEIKNWHYYLTAGYVIKLSEILDLKPTIMTKVVQGAPFEWDMSATLFINRTFWIGAAYRTGDAISGLIGLNINKHLRLGYSYDYTLTELQNFNSGSHEFTLNYEFSFDKKRIITPRYF
ncbi:MAG: hypothetical protein RIQ89_1623 [Bacteroidota bacterium]|jgi:type IX secretion system PorP/SprF family membrane protein